MTFQVKSPKKLIEVALPLDAINEASGLEKSIREGHPSTLHLWWARRPLAAARAVIFSQLVNDPSWKWELEHGGEVPPNNLKASWASSRKRLFQIIKDLVKWESSTDEEVLGRARAEILKSWREVCALNSEHPDADILFNPERLPALHDPFAGGGAIPLEAKRLGLKAFASDLNPVAVLINKALIEMPSKFAGRIPVGPQLESEGDGQLEIGRQWPGVTGLAEDIRRYGVWIENQARKRIGNLYPPVEVTKDMVRTRPDLAQHVGKKLNVISWLWARTVKSPNPAFSHIDVPLVTSFMLAKKPGKEAYVDAIRSKDGYEFVVKAGKPKDQEDIERGTKTGGSGSDFSCLMSGTPIPFAYIRAEGKAGRIGMRLMAIVAEGKRGRVYFSALPEHEAIAKGLVPQGVPETELPLKALGFRIQEYGMTKWSDLFTARQLVALTTFSNLIIEARETIVKDALAAGEVDEGDGLEEGGNGPKAYAEAISIYLAFALDRIAMTGNNLVRWNAVGEKAQHCFGRQALPMLWDFAEPNFLGTATGCIDSAIFFSYDPLAWLPINPAGVVKQADAQTQNITNGSFVSTDPPYYDNIGYADLSDFFYVWLRRSLRSVLPGLFSTIAVPKAEELVATPFRHDGKENAEKFFLSGMTSVMQTLAHKAHPEAPITIYYAFKQSETTSDSGTSSTGWETFLEAVSQSGFLLCGTWPLRTEMKTRQRALESNSLASSIVLVCRKRPEDAPVISRREFIRELNQVLPQALDEMTKGSGDEQSPVAPVDLSQAIIGPGIAVFTKYSAVLEADGSSMNIRTALQLINRFLAEDDFDADTQFCLQWFGECGWDEGPYGVAEKIATSKGISVHGVEESGVISSGKGKVRLMKWTEYPVGWNPKTDLRNPVWETTHHLIRAMKAEGESAAGILLAATSSQAEVVRQLAYRLYTLCERKGWPEDARAYNELITSWAGIESTANRVVVEGQPDLFGDKQ